MKINTLRLFSALAGLFVLVLSGPAAAYIGPGSGLGALGVLIGVIGAVLLAIISFFWYPLKRLLGRNQDSAEISEDADTSEQKTDTPAS